MIELIGWIATVLAVGGVILNNRKRSFCFVLWIISNSLSGWIHGEAGMGKVRKTTRAQQKYKEYISSEIDCTFAEWLGIKKKTA